MSKGKLLKATHGSDKTSIRLGELEIPCYVLENGQRVLSRNGIQKALGYEGTSGDWLPSFVNNKSIAPYFSAGVLEQLSTHVEFIRPNAGGSQSNSYGYDAILLIDICDAIIEAKNAGALTKRQELYAKQAEIIIRSVAKVGIIALVDEATGYQYDRERFELQKILSIYIADEILKWQLTFTDEFYKQIFRLWNLPFIPKYIKNKPSFIGKLTTKYIYDELPKGVIQKIKDTTPKTKGGHYRYRFHQSLTPEVGREHLKKQIIEVTTLMSISKSKEQFQELFKEKYDKYIQLDLEFEEEPAEIKLSNFNKSLKTAIDNEKGTK